MSMSRAMRLPALALAVLLTSCLDTTGVLNAGINVVWGDEVTGSINQALSDSLAVEVIHNNGRPLSGITVAWSVESGGGTVSPSTSVTNAAGIAKTHRILGPTVGEQTTRATVDGIGWVRLTHTSVP